MKKEKSNKHLGKVLFFDGTSGKIIDEFGKKYAFSKNDINSNINKNDLVYFKVNHIPFAGSFIEVAKFVEKLNNN